MQSLSALHRTALAAHAYGRNGGALCGQLMVLYPRAVAAVVVDAVPGRDPKH
jgi:pimeloyl-ACP methyl ester carboxylesterase